MSNTEHVCTAISLPAWNCLGGHTVSVLPPGSALSAVSKRAGGCSPSDTGCLSEFAYIHTLVCSELQPSILYRGEWKKAVFPEATQRTFSSKAVDVKPDVQIQP